MTTVLTVVRTAWSEFSLESDFHGDDDQVQLHISAKIFGWKV